MKVFKGSKRILAGALALSLMTGSLPAGSFADGASGNPVYQGFIQVTNNVSTADTVSFKGLKEKDTVFVYANLEAADENGGTKDEPGALLAKATAKKSKEGYEALVSIKDQIKGNLIWVSLAENGKKETEKIKVEVAAEEITDISYIYKEDENNQVTDNVADYFKLHNNFGLADELEIKNPYVANKDNPENEKKAIPEKTVITVYDGESGGKELAKGTIKKDGTLLIKFKNQLEEGQGPGANKIYVSLAEYNKLEGEKRIALDIPKEGETPILTEGQINLTKNISIASSLEVKNLSDKDTIRVYKSKEKVDADGNIVTDSDGKNVLEKGELFLSGKAKKSGNSIVASLSIKDQIEDGQTIYITNTSNGKKESEALAYTIKDDRDHKSKWPSITDENGDKNVFAEYILIHNNHGQSDEIEIKTPAKKDYPLIGAKAVIILYEDGALSKEIGKATVKSGGNLLIKLKDQLPDMKIIKGADGKDIIEGSPSIYFVLTEYNKEASERFEYKFKPEDGEKKSQILNVNSITGKSNEGIPSTISIKGLEAKDLVKVYKDEDKNDLLASGTAKGDSLSLSIKGQLPSKVYLTRTSYKMIEGDSVEISLGATVKSQKLADSQISLDYHIGIPHEIKITGLDDKDIIKIYKSNEDQNPILQATSKKGQALIATSLDLKGQDLYMSRTSLSLGEAESDRLVKTFYVDEAALKSREPKAENKVDILVYNNSASADIIEVRGLKEKETITIYKHNDQNDTYESTPIGQATVKKEGPLLISLKAQLEGEKIWVGLTEYGKYESTLVEKAFADELQSEALGASNRILIENNSSIADQIFIEGLKEKDLIIVYNDSHKELARGTAKKDGKLNLVFKEQLEKFDPDGKNIGDNDWPSLVLERLEANKSASAPYRVKLPIEKAASSLSDRDIKVLNNVAANDLVEIIGPVENATYRVYENRKATIEGQVHNIPGNEIGSATAKKTDKLLISLKKQIDGELIHVSISGYGEPESSPIAKLVPSEQITEQIEERDISIERYEGIASVVEVRNQSPKDIITVYKGKKADGSIGGQRIASGVADKEGFSRVSIKDINALDDLETLYLSAKTENKAESSYREVKIYAKPEANQLNPYFVQIYNNVAKADTVIVQNIFAQDRITVYKGEKDEDGGDIPGRIIGSGIAKAYGDLEVILKEELDEGGSKIFVSLTSYGKPESQKISLTIPGEKESAMVRESTISIFNYAGLSDLVKVEGLKDKDQISVYLKDKETYQLIGKGAAKKDGIVSISLKDQLPEIRQGLTEDDEGWPIIAISLTEVNKREGDKYDIKIPDEQVTKKWLNSEGNENHPAFIKVNNNVSMADSILISSVSAGTSINIYEDKDGVAGDLLATANQKKYGSISIVLKNQLKETGDKGQVTAGYIWVSRAEYGKKESEKVIMPFGWESVTNQERLDKIELKIKNNTGIPDTMELSGLYNKDLIRVYDNNTEDRIELGRGIAKADGSLLISFKDQLPENGPIVDDSVGSLYISITEDNRKESPAKDILLPKTETSIFPWVKPVEKSKANKEEAGKRSQTPAADPGKQVYGGQTASDKPGQATGTASSQQATGGSYEDKSYTSSNQPSAKSQKLDDSMVQVSSSGNLSLEGLMEGDLIKAYNEAGSLLGTARASQSGEASLRVTISESYVWLTVTEKGKLESIKIKVKI